MGAPTNGPRAAFERTYAMPHWQDDGNALDEAWDRALKNGLTPIEVVSMEERFLAGATEGEAEWATFVTLRVWRKDQ